MINVSLVRGESLPVERGLGNQVVADSVNDDGLLLIEAVGTSSETVLRRIIDLVQNAEVSKAPAQRSADRAAAILVVVAVTFEDVENVPGYGAKGHGHPPHAEHVVRSNRYVSSGTPNVEGHLTQECAAEHPACPRSMAMGSRTGE